VIVFFNFNGRKPNGEVRPIGQYVELVMIYIPQTVIRIYTELI